MDKRRLAAGKRILLLFHGGCWLLAVLFAIWSFSTIPPPEEWTLLVLLWLATSILCCFNLFVLVIKSVLLPGEKQKYKQYDILPGRSPSAVDKENGGQAEEAVHQGIRRHLSPAWMVMVVLLHGSLTGVSVHVADSPHSEYMSLILVLFILMLLLSVLWKYFDQMQRSPKKPWPLYLQYALGAGIPLLLLIVFNIGLDSEWFVEPIFWEAVRTATGPAAFESMVIGEEQDIVPEENREDQISSAPTEFVAEITEEDREYILAEIREDLGEDCDAVIHKEDSPTINKHGDRFIRVTALGSAAGSDTVIIYHYDKNLSKNSRYRQGEIVLFSAFQSEELDREMVFGSD